MMTAIVRSLGAVELPINCILGFVTKRYRVTLYLNELLLDRIGWKIIDDQIQILWMVLHHQNYKLIRFTGRTYKEHALLIRN